ncbi:MAG: tRNA lysidine(34) synthetase TilS [Alphaproteobacteria bacterium]
MLEELGPFEPSPHLAVALSGGSDSLALALLADAWAREGGGRITALIVDHRLREGSTAEAQGVAGRMRARGIAAAILTPPHAEAGNNLMQAARAWRYDALAQWCRTHDVLHCLLGHHAGDQRETVALAVARGETADGVSGMRRARNYRGVRFLRPLLGVEKETLRDLLRAQGIDWVEDPTNADLRFARGRLRGFHPLPHRGRDRVGALEALSSNNAPLLTSPRRGEERAERERDVAAAAARCAVLSPEGEARLELACWAALPEETATQLLADLVRCLGGDVFRPRRPKTLALAGWLRAQGAGQRTLGGCLLAKRGGELHIRQEKPAQDKPFRPAKPLAESPFW